MQIIGIGIGKVSLGKLSDICGRGSAFTLPTYDALVEAVSSPTTRWSASTAEISFQIEGPKIPTRLLATFRLHVEIRNIGNNEIIAGARLVAEGGQYFVIAAQVIEKPILPGETRSVMVELKPAQDVTVYSLPDFIELRLLHSISGLIYPAQNSRFPIRLCNEFRFIPI